MSERQVVIQIQAAGVGSLYGSIAAVVGPANLHAWLSTGGTVVLTDLSGLAQRSRPGALAAFLNECMWLVQEYPLVEVIFDDFSAAANITMMQGVQSWSQDATAS